MNAVRKENTNAIDYDAVKHEILDLYGVVPSSQFDADEACRLRIQYLKDTLRHTQQKGFVLGISGGVDSYTAGALAQRACEELRREGYEAYFYAVRLPAGVQRDENDAQDALTAMSPDKVLTINIGESANVLNAECLNALNTTGTVPTAEQADYHKGNIKARLRMAAQYHLAATYGSLVIGSDHNGEKVTNFYTKFGDGACDLVVLDGLSKDQVRLCAAHLGAPAHIAGKPPTADLEELNPGKLDDEGFGFPYKALNAFLEGEEIDPAIERKIIEKYVAGAHKRNPIIEFGHSDAALSIKKNRRVRP